MSPNSTAMIAFYFSCFAVVVLGRPVKSPLPQDASFQASAEAKTAFLPSVSNLHTRTTRRQSAVSDQGFGIAPGNLYSTLATLANNKAGRRSAGVPKMEDKKAKSLEDSNPGALKMYEKAVKLGKAKCDLPVGRAFMLGTISGAHIALGSMLAVSLAYRFGSGVDLNLMKILLGMFGLPLALLMTVAAGGELVTGNFAFCSAAALESKSTWEKAWRNWWSVFLGNFFGAVTVAWIAYRSSTGFADTAISIAEAKVSMSFGTLFTKGILCNWLVSMATWMATSAPDIVSKAAAVFFPVSAFVALGLEHVVANMFLIATGMHYGADVSIFEFLFKNLWPVVLGNWVGGSFFVAFLYKNALGGKLGKKKDKDKDKDKDKKKKKKKDDD